MTAMSIFSRAGLRSVGQAIASGMGAGQHPRLSIRGQSFTLLDAGGNRWQAPIQLLHTEHGQIPALYCIIVGANPHMSKVYFGGEAYDEDNTAPPVCFSDNGIGPSRDASTKMARTCAECPHSAWGSAISPMTGRGIKACADKKKIAVLVVGDTSGLVYELQVPPASLRNLGQYQGMCASHTTPDGSRQADVSDFVTAISFTPGRTGELQFTPLAWLTSVTFDGTKLAVAFDPQGNPAPAHDGGAAVAGIVDNVWNSGQVEQVIGLKDQAWTPGAAPAMVAAAASVAPPALPYNGGTPATMNPASTGFAPPPAPSFAPVPAPAPSFVPPPAPVPAGFQGGGQEPVIPPNPFAGPPGAVPAQPVRAFPSAAAPAAPVAAQDAPAASTRGRGARGGARPRSNAAAPSGVIPGVPAAPGVPANGGMAVPAFMQRRQDVPVSTQPAQQPQQQQEQPQAQAQAQEQPARSGSGFATMDAPPAGLVDQIRNAMAMAPGN